MQIKVIVNGAQGKMGELACKTIEEHSSLTLVAGLGRHDVLADEIRAKQADVVVDLTRADSVYDNSLTIIELGAHPVIGTSGLNDKQIAKLQHLSLEKKLGGLIVPNFSIGALLMMHFASIASRFFPECEIVEAHHQNKLDAPSGTALKTAELIKNARMSERAQLKLKELVSGARGGIYQDVPVHAIRLPGILAKQDVIFGSFGETLTIGHNSIDRSAFMPGLALACTSVMDLDTLYYGLEHILDLA
jgi:4-hydroxy-tetrahydrodipicolinate reductase